MSIATAVLGDGFENEKCDLFFNMSPTAAVGMGKI